MEIKVPREDANDDSATLVRWLVEDGQEVEAGQPLALLETSKTVFEVVAPARGRLSIAQSADAEVRVSQVIGQILGPEGATQPPPDSESPAAPPGPARLSQAAAASLAGRDRSAPDLKGIVSLRDLPEAGFRPRSRAYRRVLLLGAGSVGLQALDILIHDPQVRVVGLCDDHPEAHRRDLFGYPYAGPLAGLEELWSRGRFDQALITVGLNLPVRLKLYAECQRLGIPLTNAVDPSVRLNRQARLGHGNLLCSFVHLGLDCELGNNNFVAAHSSLDHHNRIGDHNLFGPGCLLSGNVQVGDRCIFGSGIVVQPNLRIGDDCQVASGAVLLKDVPAGHAVRTRLHQLQEPRAL